MATVLLTPAFVLNGLTVPPGKSHIEYCDLHPESRSLYIGVNANTPGQGIYRVRLKVNGKSTHFVIGKTTDVTLQSARQQTAALKAQLAAGVNPKAKEAPKVEELTFAKFFDDHYYPYVVTRKRSHKRDKELAARVIKVIGEKKLSEINRLMLSNLHMSLLNEEKLAPATCDLHIRFVKHALQLAVDWGMLEKNVASRFPMFNPDNRSNDFLTDAELQRFVQTVQTSDNKVIANLILFMLSSGMRLTEAMSVKWEDLNMDNRTISIPASNAKSRRLKSIPMSDMAADAILSQAAARGDSEYVWVNPKTGKRYVNINKPFDVLRKKAGVPTFKIHGLRRTFATTLANAGTSINVIQQLLTHASPVTTDRYIRVSSKTLHDATNGASLAIRAAMAAAPAVAPAPALAEAA
jgi:integrase